MLRLGQQFLEDPHEVLIAAGGPSGRRVEALEVAVWHLETGRIGLDVDILTDDAHVARIEITSRRGVDQVMRGLPDVVPRRVVPPRRESERPPRLRIPLASRPLGE